MSRSSPPRTSQHELGDFGERFFLYTLPSAWVVHAYKGSEDYGLDFHVEVFSQGKPIGLEFGAQVKAIHHFTSELRSPAVSLTRNNLLYLTSKPYPCMVVVVSESQKQAKYAWLGEILSLKALTTLLGGKWTRKRFNLDPSRELKEAGADIENYLSETRSTLFRWFSEEAHRVFITELFFDMHAALDALIECIAVIHTVKRSPDEVSHKATYSIILILMANSLLYQATRKDAIDALGPAGPPVLAIRKLFRREVLHIVPDPYLAQSEQSQKPLMIVPGAVTPFWPAVPRLATLLRDALRTLARMVAPWRDFNLRMSGLASTVIEYSHRIEGGGKKTQEEGFDSSSQNQDIAAEG